MSYTPDKIRLQELAHKWLDGTLNKAEQLEFDEWFISVNSDPIEVYSLIDSNEEEYEKDLYNKIQNQIVFGQERKVVKLWPRIAAVASILIFLSVGTYLFLKPKPHQQQIAKVQQDLKPGINGAILTLGNGQKVVLEKTKVGAIAKGVQKSNDSLLVYNNTETIEYNTLETPKGHQYSVVLPDGSKVWLNAASTLKYPTKFTGNQRLVELTGEAYFEVKHNSVQPFRVKTNNQLTEDIGTSFNINSYTDEPATVTTLIEGAVKVNDKLLKPGYSAISKLSTTTEVKPADIEQITAWKNGAFSFNKTDIKTMMRQIGRWYDVDVSYEGEVPTKTITGEVHRNVNASQALQILSFLNIHYRIEGKKIIITK